MALGARAPMFKDAILWLWTAKSVKIWRITHTELAVPFDGEFAINAEEEAWGADPPHARDSSRLSLAIDRSSFVISRMTSNAATNG